MKDLQFKTIPFEIEEKAGEKGIVRFYASIFGNVDSYGDIVEKGAFTESLANRSPVMVWSHNWDEPIGKPFAREDDKGLFVEAQLVMEVQRAKEAYHLMKSGTITEFSFGYRVIESFVDEKGYRHLTKIDLYEVSPVMIGANPLTTLVDVKSACENEEPTEEKTDDADQIVKPEAEEVKAMVDVTEAKAILLSLEAVKSLVDGVHKRLADDIKSQEVPAVAGQVDVPTAQKVLRIVRENAKNNNHALHLLKKLTFNK
jgi:HK97 family phage prohead protease